MYGVSSGAASSAMAPPMYNYPFQNQVQQQAPQYVQSMQTMYPPHAAAQAQAQAQVQAQRVHVQNQRQLMQSAYAQSNSSQTGYDGVPQYNPQAYGP